MAVAREKAAAAKKKQREERQAALQATKDPIVVVEQSDSDPEQLEGPPGVLFVRRRRPKPEKTPEQEAFERAYARMFG